MNTYGIRRPAGYIHAMQSLAGIRTAPAISGHIAAAVLSCVFGAPLAAQAQPASINPEIVETLCRTCHSDQFASQEANPHRVLDEPAWRDRTGVRPGCVNCHGDVTTHISEGGGTGNVFAFDDEPPAEINGRCLGCHSASHPEFERSAHAAAGLSCVDCHSQHDASARTALLRQVGQALGRPGNTGVSSELCIDCHEDTSAAFDLNERHRLREGTLECVSCHDPHEPATRTLLGGTKQGACLECHTDKGGPFVFEHPASRVEGCTSCHSPHGSPNRHMLSFQNTGDLCYSCHAGVPQFHLGFSPVAPPRFGSDTQCTNCHSAIHGSNFSPAFLR